MNNKSSLALVITLALTASREEVAAAVDAIHDHFDIDTAAGVSPTQVKAEQHPDLLTGTGCTPAIQGIVSDVELDSNGLPWDERIHSANKATVADGSWRARRGVDAGLKTKVEKELKATMGAAPTQPEVAPPTAAAAPPAPPAPPAAPAPAAAPNPAYASFVNFIAEQTAKGSIDSEWVKASLANFGVANGDMQNLAHRPDLIPNIEAAIRTALGL